MNNDGEGAQVHSEDSLLKTEQAARGGPGQTRSTLWRTLAMAAATGMLLLGCSKNDSSPAEGLTLAVIPKGTTHEYWKSIQAGAIKAERELRAKGTPIRLLWKGPLREDDRDQQIQVIENFISRRVDGMVLAPLDSQALAAPVASAAGAGIPVVIIDSDLKSDQIVSFIATDNFKGGEMAGQHLASLLESRGKVILLRYAVGSAATEQREAGFLKALGQFPEITLLSSDQYAGPTRESAYQAAQNLLNRYGREVSGVFAPAQHITIAMAMALRDLGRAGGQVKLVGFDAGSQPVADLERGDVQALIVQDPMRMGYLGIMKLHDHLSGGTIEKRIDTGVELVTLENLRQSRIRELLHPPLGQYLP